MSGGLEDPRRMVVGNVVSASFGTVVPTGKLFWQPEELSEPPI